MEMENLTVKGLIMTHQENLPLLVLENRMKTHILPVQISPGEASQLILHIEDMEDYHAGHFLDDFWKRHSFTLRHLELYRQKKGEIMGILHYSKGFARHKIAIPPASGIWFALKKGCPIQADRKNLLLSSANPDFTYNLDWEKENLPNPSDFGPQQPYM